MHKLHATYRQAVWSSGSRVTYCSLFTLRKDYRTTKQKHCLGYTEMTLQSAFFVLKFMHSQFFWVKNIQQMIQGAGRRHILLPKQNDFLSIRYLLSNESVTEIFFQMICTDFNIKPVTAATLNSIKIQWKLGIILHQAPAQQLRFDTVMSKNNMSIKACI